MKTLKSFCLLAFGFALASAPLCATEYVVQLKVNNGNWAFSTAGGGGPAGGNGLPRGRLMGSSTTSADRSTAFILNDVNGGSLSDGDTVKIRLYTQGLYVCAEGGGNSWVNGNRISGGGWETFTIHKASGSGTISNGDGVGFETSNGKYVCAESGGGTYLIADRTSLGAWETFELNVLGYTSPYWDTPVFNPGIWSDAWLYGAASNQSNNNCYNYGGNRITMTLAQVGRASNGYINYITSVPFLEAQVIQGLINDGFEPTTAFGVSPEGKMKVYLALEPYSWGYKDFHFYRKDVPGANWSHKPGTNTARDYDDSSATIADPSTCNRGVWTYGSGYYFIPTFFFQDGSYANII